MRSYFSHSLRVVVFGVLAICMGGLSGCDSRPADGSLVSQPQIDPAQVEEIKAQRLRQKLEYQKNHSKKAKAARGKSAG